MSAHPENCSWIYQARRVATQANVAGGAVTIDITLSGGQVARIINARMANSGTNSCNILINDEDNAPMGYLAVVGSAAGTQSYIPSIGQAAASTANLNNSTGMLLASGQTLTFYQGGAGAQGDTMTVSVTLELFNLPSIPTWSKARSVNQADVTLAASTISAANTLVSGRVWT